MAQAKAKRKQMAAEDFRAIDHTTVFWLGNGGAMICHPERFKEVACGEAVRLERL